MLAMPAPMAAPVAEVAEGRKLPRSRGVLPRGSDQFDFRLSALHADSWRQRRSACLLVGGRGEAEPRRFGVWCCCDVVMSMFGSSSSVFCSAGCLFRGACMVAHASSGAGLPADPASVAVSAAHAADARCSNHGRSSSVVMVRHHMLQNLPQPACITPRMSVGLRAMRFYAAARTPSTKFCLDLGRTECFSMSGLLHLPCARCELCERVQKSVQLRPG